MYQRNPAFIDILNQRTIKRARRESKWVLFMRNGMWSAYINSNVSCNVQKHKAIINLHYRAREFAHNSVKLCFICSVAITCSVLFPVTKRRFRRKIFLAQINGQCYAMCRSWRHKTNVKALHLIT